MPDFKTIRTKGKVVNIMHPGQDVSVNINGEKFNYHDGEIYDMPCLVAKNINETFIRKWTQSGNTQKQEKKQVYMFVPMPDPVMTEPEKKKDELIRDILEDKEKPKLVRRKK